MLKIDPLFIQSRYNIVEVESTGTDFVQNKHYIVEIEMLWKYALDNW